MRERDRSALLGGASQRFTDGMLAGAEAIRRHELRRARRRRWLPAAAALALLAVGLVAALTSLNRPRPDNVVAADPGRGSVATPAPTDTTAPTGTLAPTETPVSTETPAPTGTSAPMETPPLETARMREDEWGRVYLKDAGPFEPGEWVVLTDSDGALYYGNTVSVYETPSRTARYVSAAAGAQVRYLADAGNGFARVSFAGIEGYVAGDRLRRGGEKPATADGDWTVSSAALYVTDEQGEVHGQLIESDEAVAAYALRMLLFPACLGNGDGAVDDARPYGALLVVELQPADGHMLYDNGVERFITLRYTMPRDGELILRGEWGQTYALAGADSRFFWRIFDQAAEWVWLS